MDFREAGGRSGRCPTLGPRIHGDCVTGARRHPVSLRDLSGPALQRRDPAGALRGTGALPHLACTHVLGSRPPWSRPPSRLPRPSARDRAITSPWCLGREGLWPWVPVPSVGPPQSPKPQRRWRAGAPERQLSGAASQVGGRRRGAPRRGLFRFHHCPRPRSWPDVIQGLKIHLTLAKRPSSSRGFGTRARDHLLSVQDDSAGQSQGTPTSTSLGPVRISLPQSRGGGSGRPVALSAGTSQSHS